MEIDRSGELEMTDVRTSSKVDHKGVVFRRRGYPFACEVLYFEPFVW